MSTRLSLWRSLVLLLVGLASSASALAAIETNILGKLPDDFIVYAVGTYSGTSMIDAQIDKSGHEAGQANVVVNVPDRPVLLVLTAYDPCV